MKWKRPTGTTIETSDNKDIRAYAKENDWKEVKNGNRKPSGQSVSTKNPSTSK